MLKVYVVGRHEFVAAPDMPKFEVIGQENITWPASEEATRIELNCLFARAAEAGADTVIFQGIPAQLTAALVSEARLNGEAGWPDITWVGAIVNEPRPDLRKVPTVKIFDFDTYEPGAGPGLVALAAEAIKAANPRAKVEVNGTAVSITVEPPIPFKPVRTVWF